MTPSLLFDIGFPGGGMAAAAVGIGFFIAIVAVAYVVFRLLRKTLKMAFRMAIVIAFLLIAVVGSLSLWWFSDSSNVQRSRPSPTRR